MGGGSSEPREPLQIRPWHFNKMEFSWACMSVDLYKCDIPFWFLFLFMCMWLLAKPHHHNWRLFLISLKLSVVRWCCMQPLATYSLIIIIILDFSSIAYHKLLITLSLTLPSLWFSICDDWYHPQHSILTSCLEAILHDHYIKTLLTVD